MRLVLVALVALLSPIIANVQKPNPRNSNDSSPKIELKLVLEKATIRPGERVKLRVELWNLGPEDVIIAQNLDSTFGNSTLGLILGAGFGEETSGSIGDRFPEPGQPDFEKTFVTNWLTLNKNHFYGTYVFMDPIEFPHLRKPGQYKVRAQYISRGISSTPGWNGGYLKQEDVEKLPLSALKGTISSNTVTVQVSAKTTAIK
jgi:hypothetical protein